MRDDRRSDERDDRPADARRVLRVGRGARAALGAGGRLAAGLRAGLRATLVAGLLAGCSSCGSATPAPGPGPVTPTGPIADAPRLDLPPPSDAQAAGFAGSSNALGVDLLQAAGARPANLALSPASIAFALSMTYGGARGETQAQMARVLHHGGEPEALHEASSRMLALLGRPGEHELRVVNRLFGERTFTFEAPFLALTRERYGAELEPVDFRGDPDASRLHINAWVAAQTRERIRDLLPPPSITPSTRMVLTNAVYFLGRWEAPFEREATFPAPFHRIGGGSQAVPTMHQLGHLRYAEDAEAQLVELPYRGGELAMLFVLPRAREGLPSLVRDLSADKLAAWAAALAPQRVAVALPKIMIDPAEPLSLAQHLAALGMPLAFDAERADFTAMGRPPDPRMRLFVSDVFHKAFVRIDEEGTEAAAATAVVMAEGAGMPAPATPFDADHPFLFVLRDLRSGTALFFGLVYDPAV